MMFKVRLQLSYNGESFCGWQNQKDHKNKLSVQFRLEKALSHIFHETIHCVPSSRTDAGVHAVQQNVHFCVEKDPRSLPLLKALRTLLPPTISVEKAWLAPTAFNANLSAEAKTYRYAIWKGKAPSALLAPMSYWYPHTIDDGRLNEYAQALVGCHDFKTFQTMGGTPPKTSVREIYRARWLQRSKNLLIFEITGKGFLKQMIRNLVSTQLRFQAQQSSVDEFKALIEKRDRRAIGKSAPPQGLFLYRVHYGRSLRKSLIPIKS